MADKILYTRITNKNDTTANWNTEKPVLLKGELGVEFDGEDTKLKVGDGISTWDLLPYIKGTIGEVPNNATITVQKNGVTVKTFTLNQATDETINITVPTTAADVGAIPATEKGSNNGVAELDSTGKVPSSQLPSFVDDVQEYNSMSDFPATGEAGKIYIAKDTNLTYRWSGSQYTEISPSLALGETSTTAYRGDRGKIAYEYAISEHAPVNAQANVIETVATETGDLTPTNKKVTIPTATAAVHGLVKSATGLNNVTVASTGVMTVASLSTDKLTQGSDTLIFDCGNATL